MFCLVELARLELATPCLQIVVSTCGRCPDLRWELSASDRDVPLIAGVNGTLMARCHVGVYCVLLRWAGLSSRVCAGCR